MSRKNRDAGQTNQRRNKTQKPAVQQFESFQPIPPTKRSKTPLKAKTPAQERYITAIKQATLIFGLGPAGTGKTYIAGAIAAEQIDAKAVEKIIITRPAVEAEEELGFLPGEIEDKYAPYIAPFLDVLEERLGKSYVEYLMKAGQIEASPLAYMRGKTFKNAIVILDEAQNTTPSQMKLFLSRIGENCTVIVNGDESQKDISGPCGLTDAVAKVAWIPAVRVIKFRVEDVVRSGIVHDILCSYENKEGHKVATEHFIQ